MIKKPFWQKLKYLDNEKSFSGEIKNIFNPFKNIFSCQRLYQTLECAFNDFLSKCDQIRRNLRIWSYLLKKSLMKNFIFCTVYISVEGKIILGMRNKMFYKKEVVSASFVTYHITQKQPSGGALEKVFWKNAENLQENTHTEVWFQ